MQKKFMISKRSTIDSYILKSMKNQSVGTAYRISWSTMRIDPLGFKTPA
jgi:hypothetical protein